MKLQDRQLPCPHAKLGFTAEPWLAVEVCALAEVLEWEVGEDLVAKATSKGWALLSLEMLVHSGLVTPGWARGHPLEQGCVPGTGIDTWPQAGSLGC